MKPINVSKMMEKRPESTAIEDCEEKIPNAFEKEMNRVRGPMLIGGEAYALA
jgi:hypothetical protein